MGLRSVVCLFVAAVAGEASAQSGWTTVASPVYPDWISSTAYDPVQQCLWAFRFTGAGVDVHRCDGATWTVVPQPTAPPISVLGGTAAVHDPVRDVFVHTVTTPGFQLQTWEWDRSNWTLRNTRSAPTALGRLVFHQGRGTVFGVGLVTLGTSQSGLQFLEWLPPNWVVRATAPGPSDSHDMVYHQGRGELVVVYRFGGLHRTWSWNLVRWLELVPPQLSESYLDLAYDPVHQRLLGFHNSFAMTTYELLPSGWRQHQHGRRPPYAAGFGWRFTPMPHLDRIALVQNQPYLATRTGTYLYDHAEPLPASYAPLGAGCAGSQGVPSLAAAPGQAPWLGSAFAAVVGNLPAGAPLVALGTGFDAGQWQGQPLPRDLGFAGLPGCLAHCAPEFAAFAVPAGGSAAFALPLPLDLDLLGLPFYHQAIVLDPLAGNPAGAVVSDARAGVLGF